VLLLSLSPPLGSPDTFSGLFHRFVEGRPALQLLERLGLCMDCANRGGLDAVRTGVAMTPGDVHDVYVVRKQLYISEEHERALKARARELGVSEAELVRRMLDGWLLDVEGGRGLAGSGAAETLEGFLEEADRLAESHRFQRGYVFDRNELYEDRV
jgi:hypothetical protein